MELRFHCRRLLSLVQDVESGSRGYLLSGQESFLAPFILATNAIPIEFAHLYESEAGNPAQQKLLQELEPVIAARLELARQAIASRGTNDLAAAAAVVRGGQAKALMDKIRRLTADLDDQIDTLRQTQQSAAEQQIREEYFVLQLGLLLGLATLLGVLINLTDSLQERRRMEASLRRARSHYQNLLRIASDGIHIFDLEGKLLEASDSFYQMLGYSPQDPTVLRVGDWDAQWSAAELNDRMHQVTEFSSVFETRHRRRDGQTIEVEISTRVIDLEGQRYIYASSRDITERKRVATALREQAEEFQDLYDHAPCGYHSINRDDVIVRMNKTELAWLGYRPEEVIGKIKLTDLLSERTRPRYRETFRQLQVGDVAPDMEVELTRKDGSLMPTLVSSTAVRDAAGNFLLSRSTSNDITKRKQEWQRLMDSEARLVEAQKIAHLGSWEQVMATGQIRWSAEMYRLFGLAPGIAKLTPEQALAYAHPEDRERVAATVASAVAAKQDYDLEYRIRDANGVERHVRSLGHVVLDDGGRVVRTRGVTQDITEQTLAETKLRQSEQTYRNQFVHNTAVMLLIDPQNAALLDANDAALAFYGYPREQMLGLRINDLNVLPEPEVRKIVASVATQKAKQFEFKHRLANGDLRDIQASVCPIQTGGRVVLHAIIFDISGRKQAEAEREQFFKFFNLSPDLMMIADPAGCFLRVNPATIQLLGYTEAELLERPFINFIHPDDRPATAAEMSRQLTTGSSMDFVNRYQRKDGDYLSLSWRATYMPADGVAYATARDITEQRQAEAAVRVSEARYRTLVENIPQKIFLISRDLKLVSVNQNYARDLGCRPEDAVGKDDYDFFPTALAEKYRADDRRILETGQTEELEEKYILDGHEIWVHTTKAPVRDRSGKIIGIFGIFWDITAQKQAEAKILELNGRLEQRVRERTAALEVANQELESFAYSVSHDLRTPLRAMDGFSRVLLEDYEHRLEPEGRDCLRRVRTASQRMGQLIDAILMLSRLSREQMQVTPVNLSALVQEVTHELQRATPERVVQLVVAPEVTVAGDARLLRVALTNLLSNAWKFTHQQPAPRVEFGQIDRAGDWVGFVRDNGAGFDMAYAKQLFRPFQRLHNATEFPGTGIGLAIVQRVIHRHGGRLWAEAAIDQGATFYFTLPTKASEKGDSRPPAGPHGALKHEQ